MRGLALELSGGDPDTPRFRTMLRKLNGYQAGTDHPSDERAAEIAEALGLPPDRYKEALFVDRTVRRLKLLEEERRRLREVLAPYAAGPPPRK